MFNKMKDNNDVLVLEIDEKDGVVASYQRTLYEASLLGIDKVKFICVWSEEENPKRERGEDIFPKITKTCEILNINPCDNVTGYYGKMYDGPMMGKITEKGYFEFSSISGTFEDYKNSIDSLPTRERVGKILAKHIDSLIETK